MKSWVLVDFKHLESKSSYCLNLPCGAGKSNAIKQMAMMLWSYSRNNDSTKKMLLVVERIEDGLRLENILHLLKLYKQNNKNMLISRWLDCVSIDTSKKFFDDIFRKSLKDLIKFKVVINEKNGKFYPEIDMNSEKPSDICFTCSADEKVCIKGYSDYDFLSGVCKTCEEISCPANYKRKDKAKNSTVRIVTHNSILKNQHEKSIWIDGKDQVKPYVLIDEKPDVININTLIFKGKKGVLSETPFDDFIQSLRDRQLNNIATKIEEEFISKFRRIFSDGSELLDKYASGDRKNELYKLGVTPKLPDELKNIVQKLQTNLRIFDKFEIRKEVDDKIKLLLSFNEKTSIYFFKNIGLGSTKNGQILTISHMENNWKQVCHPKSCTIVFDGTAHFDPIFSLEHAPRIIKLGIEEHYPNVYFRFYTEKDRHKDKVNSDEIQKILNEVFKVHDDENILFVCSKENKTAVLEQLNKIKRTAYVEHWGNIKGKNDYISSTVLVVLDLPRKPDYYYMLLANEINRHKNKIDYNFPKKWSVKKGKGNLVDAFDKTLRFREAFLDTVRSSTDAVEIIQVIFRTAIRNDSKTKASIYLPIASSGLTKKVLEPFIDSKIEKKLI